jgi:hypothetical protein
VHSLKRRSSSIKMQQMDHLEEDPYVENVNFFLHKGMADATNLIRLPAIRDLESWAQSHIQVRFETPQYTANADGLGTLCLLAAIRVLRTEKLYTPIRHRFRSNMVTQSNFHRQPSVSFKDGWPRCCRVISSSPESEASDDRVQPHL